VFQAAIRVARRVARETTIHSRRISIPSVAVTDFAQQVFERFDDKTVLIIGAGEMGKETARYLLNEGARNITVVSRNRQRAVALAEECHGTAADWQELEELLVAADLVVSTTGAGHPIVTLEHYRQIAARRFQRTQFILDLAVPRDFDPRISQCLGAYLFSIDDLKETCEANRSQRQQEWPKAQRIIDEEIHRFLAQWSHRATGPTIRRLRDQADRIKQDELDRLIPKIAGVDARSRHEIQLAFDRLVNKLLHSPLESLRDEAAKGTPPHGLLDALRRLFQLKD
jgi:glutamyl-tRNA reductase